MSECVANIIALTSKDGNFLTTRILKYQERLDLTGTHKCPSYCDSDMSKRRDWRKSEMVESVKL